MTVVLTFSLAAVVTFALRSWMTVAGGRLVESPRFAELTALVTPAVLAAMIASGLLLTHGRASVPAAGALLAVLAAFWTVRRSGNVAVGLVVGLAVHALALAVGLS